MVGFFLLSLFALTAGAPISTFEEIRTDIVLRRVCQKGHECVNIRECPNLAQKLIYKSNDAEKRKVLEEIACEIEKKVGVLDVCCPKEYIVKYADKTLSGLNDPMCGRPKFHAHLNSKELALEFPWLAILQYEEGGKLVPKCGGSLIGNRWILTAAHCLTDGTRTLPLRNVRLGGELYKVGEKARNRNGRPTSHTTKVYRVADITPHEQYDVVSLRNDIGLVKLMKPALFTDFIKPICLPVDESKIELNELTELNLAGWNYKNLSERNEPHAFRTLTLNYLNNSYCEKGPFRHYGTALTTSQLCARGIGQNACSGDSGGPLMTNIVSSDEITIWYEVGLVSYAYGNCNQNLAAVYTKVQPYLNWINTVIHT